MNRFIAIVALSLVPVQWAWAQEDTVQSNPQTRETLWFESNAILESLKTIQLLAVQDQPLLSNDISIEAAAIVDPASEPLKVELSSKPGHIHIKYDLEGISTVLLMIRASDNAVAWKMPVMHRAKGTYQEDVDLEGLQAGNYQISLTTEFGIYHRRLSLRQMEGIATTLKKDLDSKDHNDPE